MKWELRQYLPGFRLLFHNRSTMFDGRSAKYIQISQRYTLRLNCSYGLIAALLCRTEPRAHRARQEGASLGIQYPGTLRTFWSAPIAYDCYEESPIGLLHTVHTHTRCAYNGHGKQTSSSDSLRMKITIGVTSAFLVGNFYPIDGYTQRSITPCPLRLPHPFLNHITRQLDEFLPVRYPCHDGAPLPRKREHRRRSCNAYITPTIRVPQEEGWISSGNGVARVCRK